MPNDSRERLRQRIEEILPLLEAGDKEGLVRKLEEWDQEVPIDLPWLRKPKPCSESPDEQPVLCGLTLSPLFSIGL